MYKSTIIMIIIILLCIIGFIYGCIEAINTKYLVVTYDNEVIEVDFDELYSDKMYIYRDNEKIKIKSYKKINKED